MFFLDGLDRTRLSFHRDGDDLLILVDKDMNQQVRVTDHFLGSATGIEEIVFNNGMVWDRARIEELIRIGGSCIRINSSGWPLRAG